MKTPRMDDNTSSSISVVLRRWHVIFPKELIFMKVAIDKPLPVYPAPAFLVGVYDEEGRAGGLVAAWAGVCCSEPPCISIAVQKVRHSFGGIMARKAFTVNVPSEVQVAETDYFGIFSGKGWRQVCRHWTHS